MTNIAKLVVDLAQRTSDSPGRPLPGDSPAVGMISARLLQNGVVGDGGHNTKYGGRDRGPSAREGSSDLGQDRFWMIFDGFG